MTRIGILTAGGDAPGLNAAIRAVVRSAIGVHGFEVVGFRGGWRGVIDHDVVPLTASAVQGILHRGVADTAKVRPVPEELFAVAQVFFE